MEKKILGFDVGIKNLAYCILSVNEKEYKIKKWGIINLDEDRKLCTFMLRTKKECGKTASGSYQDEDKKDHYLCSTHLKKHQPEEFGLENLEVPESKQDKSKLEKCCFKVEDINCVKNATCRLKDELYCKSHGNTVLKTLKKDNKVKKLNQSCGSIPILVLTKKLCKKLDEHADFLQVDEVLIENQPSMLNPKMKTISSILYSYFTINGIGNAEKNKSTITNVKFNAPSNKLKVNKDGTTKILKLADAKKEEYDYTKELGVEFCRVLIKDDKVNLQILDKEDKKDDLCDAFLHAFQYYYNNKKLLAEKKEDLDLVVDKMFKKICNKKNITCEEGEKKISLKQKKK